MLEFILSHKFEYFKKYLLREHPEPSYEGKYFYLDPFLLNYFNNKWDIFKTHLDSPSVKQDFEKEENGKEFYEFLVQVVDSSNAKKNEKFIIKDKKIIELAEKFIEIIQ
ncbi:MAG: hypothetical protein IPM91_08730 [Bacteroidetes bacterium]|nr:hypothetical protein [Bacteroidota bacterium]